MGLIVAAPVIPIPEQENKPSHEKTKNLVAHKKLSVFFFLYFIFFSVIKDTIRYIICLILGSRLNGYWGKN